MGVESMTNIRSTGEERDFPLRYSSGLDLKATSRGEVRCVIA